ncbi:MAG TPA: protein-L-isoaspartate(D-aspartate) O-methyltransferase [Sideroxyarcus sp.]|nr:protein-L-isoaspartate(D-aspartate) O-methyltransferase [Sideroxyarcus sp.]
MRTADQPDVHVAARQRMVDTIRAISREDGGYAPRPVSERVLAVMAKVPRHRFVPEGEEFAAYANHPLSIGHGQTISQPYIVALMSDLLALDKQQCVLEIGTGSGYQTAVLAELAGQVYSVEIVAPLAAAAAQLLAELGYANAVVQAGDGSAGWPEHAPYDAIIVTAAADRVPQLLLEQLKPGGRMVIPVGGRDEIQQLMLITKGRDGKLRWENIEPVRFVPLTGAG